MTSAQAVEATPACGAAQSPTSGRWELIRALGALTLIAPPADQPISAALGLAAWDRADHTRLFVLDLPPYASIYLDPQGKIGGDAADRIAGLWRALGLDPPADADHLSSLCHLYAELGHAGEHCRTEPARRRLDHARHVVLSEHMVPWLPVYLAAVAAYPSGRPWADLTLAALRHETRRHPPLPVAAPALGSAPAPIGDGFGLDELLDTLVSPLRSGVVLTHTDLERAGRTLGIGTRRGERRYSLRAMLDHDPDPTIAWVCDHARRWVAIHRQSRSLHPANSQWWQHRAQVTAAVLERQAPVGQLPAVGANRPSQQAPRGE